MLLSHIVQNQLVETREADAVTKLQILIENPKTCFPDPASCTGSHTVSVFGEV